MAAMRVGDEGSLSRPVKDSMAFLRETIQRSSLGIDYVVSALRRTVTVRIKPG